MNKDPFDRIVHQQLADLGRETSAILDPIVLGVVGTIERIGMEGADREVCTDQLELYMSAVHGLDPEACRAIIDLVQSAPLEQPSEAAYGEA